MHYNNIYYLNNITCIVYCIVYCLFICYCLDPRNKIIRFFSIWVIYFIVLFV